MKKYGYHIGNSFILGHIEAVSKADALKRLRIMYGERRGWQFGIHNPLVLPAGTEIWESED
jgi:hypothetical protein